MSKPYTVLEEKLLHDMNTIAKLISTHVDYGVDLDDNVLLQIYETVKSAMRRAGYQYE